MTYLQQSTQNLHPDINDFRELIYFRPPEQIQREKTVQYIEDGVGKVNLDYYAVQVNKLPPGTSPEELLKDMRMDMNKFINTDHAKFSSEAADANRLKSDPVGVPVHIDMYKGSWNVADGSVVVSESKPKSFTFSTISTWGDPIHPVSGNRQFGFEPNPNGGYIFYVRGADRLSSGPNLARLSPPTTFESAHTLWLSWQQKLTDNINQAGGQAEKGKEVSKRYSWEAVERHFNPGKRSISDNKIDLTPLREATDNAIGAQNLTAVDDQTARVLGVKSAELAIAKGQLSADGTYTYTCNGVNSTYNPNLLEGCIAVDGRTVVRISNSQFENNLTPEVAARVVESNTHRTASQATL